MFEDVVGHKFKVGDEVRIIGNQASHEFDIDAIVTITDINNNDDTCTYLCVDNANENIEWWASEEDIELVGSDESCSISVSYCKYTIWYYVHYKRR